jgi:prepilin-type processing-associated H-X9-DG protein
MPATAQPRPARRFTLIEVVLVVTVLLLLAALLLPVLQHAREKARRANCAGCLKSLGLTCLMYSGDHSGYFPNAHPNTCTNWEPLAMQNYVVQDGRIWACPSRTTVTMLAMNSAYRYIGSGLKDDNKSAAMVSLAYDQSNNHPGNQWCNVLFVDGHVEGARPANNPNFAND